MTPRPPMRSPSWFSHSAHGAPIRLRQMPLAPTLVPLVPAVQQKSPRPGRCTSHCRYGLEPKTYQGIPRLSTRAGRMRGLGIGRTPRDLDARSAKRASVLSQKSANKSKACGGTPSTTGPAGQPASGRRGENGHSCLLALHSTARRAPLGRWRRSKAGRFSTEPGARRGVAAGRRIIKRTSNSGH
jgi:hypothetical protein